MLLLNTEKELNNSPLLRPNHLRFINSFNFLSHAAESVAVLTVPVCTLRPGQVPEG